MRPEGIANMESGNRITGVGCFAKPPTLARVLKRAVEAYLTTSLDALGDPGQFSSSHDTGTKWLNYLISEQAGPLAADRDEWLPPGAVSGFYLEMVPGSLQLSIFTGRGGIGHRHRTTNLDDVASLRRRRLH